MDVIDGTLLSVFKSSYRLVIKEKVYLVGDKSGDKITVAFKIEIFAVREKPRCQRIKARSGPDAGALSVK